MNIKELQAPPNWSISKGCIDITRTPEEIQRDNKISKAVIEFQETMAKDLQSRLEKTPLKEVFEKEGVKDLARKNVVKPDKIRNIPRKLMFTIKAKI